MRHWIRPDPKDPLAYALLISDAGLPKFGVPDGMALHLHDLDTFVSYARQYRKGVARDALKDHPVIQWVRNQKVADGGPSVLRLMVTGHRMTRELARKNHVGPGEWLLGLSFRFRDKITAAQFKAAWQNAPSGELWFKH